MGGVALGAAFFSEVARRFGLKSLIGIRREDKNRWERRTPLVPAHVEELAQKHGIELLVQPSELRVFPDEEYERAGAVVHEDLSICPVVLAVKEIPTELLRKERTYVFFSHTIKGQSQNMAMLRRLMELGCDLIDYERIVDDEGRRLIFFGRHAGLAGMIDTLWALGKRLKEGDGEGEGIETPLLDLYPAHAYRSLGEAKEAVAMVGQKLAKNGVPEALRPLVCGFAGYGHVSQGAQEIFDLLPVETLSPEELLGADMDELAKQSRTTFKVVFQEEDMVQPKEEGGRFELQDYYHHPERYEGKFGAYLDRLTVLMNCIYWEERYPRLVTKARLEELYAEAEKKGRGRGEGSEAGGIKLRMIGDVSCDVEGAVEATVKATDPGDPVFVYDPVAEEAKMGFSGRGVGVLAVDNLPCELPKESSEQFSEALKGFVAELAGADMRAPVEECGLGEELRRALVLHRGKLTPEYDYIKEFLQGATE
jgi:alpha-aminoadipic semialdehyde synthase